MNKNKLEKFFDKLNKKLFPSEKNVRSTLFSDKAETYPEIFQEIKFQLIF